MKVGQLELFAPPEAPATPVKPNEHGVYPPDIAERIELANPRKGWRGAPLAEIALLHIDRGWLRASGLMLAEYGYGEPLMANCVFPDRSEALSDAMERLRKKVTPYAEGRQDQTNQRQARAVLGWLDSIA